VTDRHRPLALAGGLWLFVMAAALFARPPLPVDETRYLAVAWDMWLEGHFLVPHLNGEPYSHKPPLLFWLINLGWWAFGVNEWWPRLIAPMAGLASLLLTARLAGALWPGDGAARRFAPVLLFGGAYWALFTTLTMFDMLLALFALLALLGLVRAARQGGFGGFALAGLAIGLGALTKGPAILVHVLPVAVAAPWWARRLDGVTAPARLGVRWAAGVAAAVAIGAAIGLAWAVPAGIVGGPEYRDAILWGQSAGRLVDSFAHAEPWWLYVVVLPALLLPWTAWPPAWRAARRLGGQGGDGGMRLCTIWFVTALLAFSTISGKQLHYLLPELPALALLLARLLAAEAQAPPRPADAIPPALLAAAVGAAVVALPAVVPRLTGLAGEAPWLDQVAAGWGAAPIVAGAAVVAARRLDLAARLSALAAMTAVAVVALHLALKPALAAFYDLRPLAARLAEWQGQGIALANFGKYHGQYHFLGRLTKPIAVVGLQSGDEKAFLAAHPTGRIVAYHDALPKRPEARPVAVFRFRSRLIAVWDAATVVANPGITHR